MKAPGRTKYREFGGRSDKVVSRENFSGESDRGYESEDYDDSSDEYDSRNFYAGRPRSSLSRNMKVPGRTKYREFGGRSDNSRRKVSWQNDGGDSVSLTIDSEDYDSRNYDSGDEYDSRNLDAVSRNVKGEGRVKYLDVDREYDSEDYDNSSDEYDSRNSYAERPRSSVSRNVKMPGRVKYHEFGGRSKRPGRVVSQKREREYRSGESVSRNSGREYHADFRDDVDIGDYDTRNFDTVSRNFEEEAEVTDSFDVEFGDWLSKFGVDRASPPRRRRLISDQGLVFISSSRVGEDTFKKYLR